MFLFRIGGDEFAVVTALESVEDAEALARKIIAKNGVAVSMLLCMWTVRISRIT